MKNIFLALSVLVLGGCVGIFGQYETPSYAVTQKEGAIELREYAPYLAAETDVSGAREEAMNNGFRIVADFIFGNNTTGASVAMTTPVLNKAKSEKISMTAPVLQKPAQDGVWTVRFAMPKTYTLETLPKPNDKRVRIVKVPSERMLAIRFSGSWRQQNFDKHEKQLRNYAAANNISLSTEAERAFYNPPFTLPFLRRNEVLIPVKG